MMRTHIGLLFNGKHTWHTFRCRISNRKIGQPEKHRIIETVPHSNAMYNFSTISGAQTYGERDLEYQLELHEDSQVQAQKTLRNIAQWLDVSEYLPLYDEMLPGHYFMAEPLAPKIEERNNLYLINITFKAAPMLYPITPTQNYTASSYPDLNGDGVVDATDASIILEAATAVGAGEATGLTPMQEVLADVDRDGIITATDASIVTDFATAVGTGAFENTPDGWAEYMNARYPKKEETL